MSARTAATAFAATLLAVSPAFALSTGPSNCVPTPVTIGVNSTFHADLSRNADIGWVRVNLRWRNINPSPNVWDFIEADNIVNAARSRGLEVLGILSTAPMWAGGGPNGNTPPANTSYWSEYVRRVAQRYSGQIAAYQVWNEPNLENRSSIGVGWDRPITQSPLYTDYLRLAALEIRAQAPGTLVVGPGTASEPNGRTTTIFRQIQTTNSSQYVDVVNFNANGTNRSVSQMISWVNGNLNTISVENPSNRWKPIWITEMGWWSGSVGESGQSTRIQQLIAEMRGQTGFSPPLGGPPICNGWSEWNITHAFIYTIIDGGGDTSGIYRANRTPKPVVTQYLQPKPFPATDVDPIFDLPFSVSCAGRTCTFVSSTTPGSTTLFPLLWDFGDGVQQTVPAVQVTHTFPRSGWFFVKSIQVTGGSVRLIKVP